MLQKIEYFYSLQGGVALLNGHLFFIEMVNLLKYYLQQIPFV